MQVNDTKNVTKYIPSNNKKVYKEWFKVLCFKLNIFNETNEKVILN